MYELHNIYTVEPNLVPTIVDQRVKRRVRDIFKACLKHDPTLVFLFATELPSLLPHGVLKDPQELQKLFQTHTIRALVQRSEDFLPHTPPSAMHRFIHIFRTWNLPSFLTITPHNYEYDLLYGGTDGEAQVMLWLPDTELGNIIFAGTRIKNKESALQIIRDTNTGGKISVHFQGKLTDLYRIEEPEAPNRYNVWIT